MSLLSVDACSLVVEKRFESSADPTSILLPYLTYLLNRVKSHSSCPCSTLPYPKVPYLDDYVIQCTAHVGVPKLRCARFMSPRILTKLLRMCAYSPTQRDSMHRHRRLSAHCSCSRREGAQLEQECDAGWLDSA